MFVHAVSAVLVSLLFAPGGQSTSAPRRVAFSAVATPVPVHRPFEVTVTVDPPSAADCERDGTVVGEFAHQADDVSLRRNGHCASRDGSRFRVGFVPEKPGEYSWRVVYTQGEFQRAGTGSVTVVARERAPSRR